MFGNWRGFLRLSQPSSTLCAVYVQEIYKNLAPRRVDRIFSRTEAKGGGGRTFPPRLWLPRLWTKSTIEIVGSLSFKVFIREF